MIVTKQTMLGLDTGSHLDATTRVQCIDGLVRWL